MMYNLASLAKSHTSFRSSSNRVGPILESLLFRMQSRAVFVGTLIAIHAVLVVTVGILAAVTRLASGVSVAHFVFDEAKTALGLRARTFPLSLCGWRFDLPLALLNVWLQLWSWSGLGVAQGVGVRRQVVRNSKASAQGIRIGWP